MATLAQIKTWWSQVLRPTVEQRNETWDSIRLKSDAIAIGEITELQTALNNKADAAAVGKKVLAAGTTYYDVPAATILTGFWFQGGAACTIGVGYTNSDTNLCDQGDLPANGDLLFQTYKPFRAVTRIYFNGIQSDTITIIYYL